MKLCILIVVIAVVLIFGGWLINKREGFTTHERDGVLCPPFLNGIDEHLLPPSVVFVVQGYNYKDTPKIYRDGQLVTPLQYAWDYANMTYFLVVSAPFGLCDSMWILETTDFVKPLVFEGRTAKRMTVELERRRNDFHKWSLSC